MSFEEPGDGIRCDHCNALAASTRDGRLGFLCPFRAPAEAEAEVLCSLCMEIKRQRTPTYVTVVEREGAVPQTVKLDPSAPRMATPRDYRKREGWTPTTRRRAR